MSKFSNLKKKILADKNCPKIINNASTIHVNINNTNEILSPYTEDNKPIINTEFANFLDNSVKDISVKQDLTIEITSGNHNPDTISSAIKNYYYNEFMDSQRKLKFNLILVISTLIIGIIALAVTLVEGFNLPRVINGTIDIFAWVFIWEAFDLFFFRRAELRHEQHRQMNFINAKIILK